jgi:uncharacterized integral membrane protein
MTQVTRKTSGLSYLILVSSLLWYMLLAVFIMAFLLDVIL